MPGPLAKSPFLPRPARCLKTARHARGGHPDAPYFIGVTMARRKKVYEGKAKILYEGPEPGTLVQYFKDDATAFNAQKKDVIDGKGV